MNQGDILSNSKFAFDHLVERILAGACTPFLGAGISSQSKKQGEDWSGHKVWEMARKVVHATVIRLLRRLPIEERSLCSKCHGKYLSRLATSCPIPPKIKCTCRICALRQIEKQSRLAEACEAYLWEYGELPDDKRHYRDLVNTLEIAEFANLDPTPAHIYLTYLAREGLLTEFITTNYDCNLEKAYRATFSPAVQNAGMDTIASLEDYTRLAGERGETRPGKDSRHRPKQYKINGCAGKLKNDKAEAENILLTEGQLQGWRTRHWAEDLFRVKFRSSCVVLVGFGNEEPQIRHK